MWNEQGSEIKKIKEKSFQIIKNSTTNVKKMNIRKFCRKKESSTANIIIEISLLFSEVSEFPSRVKLMCNFLVHFLYDYGTFTVEYCYVLFEFHSTYILFTVFSLINVALRLFFLGKYSRPYTVIKDPSFIYFWKKIFEKLGENRKKWLLSKTSI